MFRSAALSLVMLSACVVAEDAKPALSTIDLSTGAEVSPNEPISIRVTGNELWGRPLELEVHFAPEAGGDRVVKELPLRFDQALDTQTASTTWKLDPSLIRDAGRTEIYFIAVAEGARLESERIFVETHPVLLDIELSTPALIVPGSELTATITGTDVWSRELEVNVLRNGAPIESLAASFDNVLSRQTAHATWRVAGDFLDRPGRHELRFRATLGAEMIESEAAIIDVRSEITALALFREGPRGRQALQAGDSMPAVEDLVLAVSGTALVGLTSTITVYRTPNTVLAEQHLNAGNSFEVSFRPKEEDFALDSSMRVFFRAAIAGEVMDSATVTIERSGFSACDWYLPNGQVLQDHATLDSGALVVLRAETWGLENMSGAFEIWEQDSTSDDDFVLRLDTNTDPSIAQAEWTAVYIDDGALATEAEYYFLGDIGGRACRSPLLIISQ